MIIDEDVVLVKNNTVGHTTSDTGKTGGLQHTALVDQIGQQYAEPYDHNRRPHKPVFQGQFVVDYVAAAMGALRKDRCQPAFKDVGTAQGCRHAEITGPQRPHRQHYQRPGHPTRRLVQVLAGVLVGPRLTEKGHEHQAEHVKSRQRSTAEARRPQYRAVQICLPEIVIVAAM